MIGKEKIVFDPANASETDNIGAYVTASDGTLITHTTDGSKERLDVSTGAEHDDGAAFVAGDRGNLVLAVDDSGNYAPLKVNSSGELLVDVNITSGSDKAEDSAHVSGDIGTYVLAVRQDVLAPSTSSDGDYQSFKVDADGALYTKFTNTTIEVTQGTSPWVTSASQSGTWSVGLTEDHNYGVAGGNTLRTASQIGNATGAADFGAGATSGQTLRTVSNQGGTWSVGLTEDHNYGAITGNSLRVASQIGNASGAADFGAGATSGQTLRVVLPTDQSAIPVTQSTSPWVVSGTDINPTCDNTLANAAVTVGVVAAPVTAALATRRRIIIQNVDTSKAIYLGDSSVTTGTGLRLSPGSALELELAAGTSLYAIAGTAGIPARVLETGHA